MPYIEITRDHGDLEREWWRFNSADRRGGIVVWVGSYAYQTRATKRHKFWSVKEYDCIRTNRENEDVPLPDDVAAEAKRRLCEMVVVRKTLEG